MSTDLKALQEKRQKWVEANRENGFDEGISRLLTELYPDNAHFIYELLQNAEDPQATEVRFKLTDSAVEFAHNGKRLFTLKDVDSITSIGKSTKRDDATSIGKFGVGFKAVFAYTNTPEIHSGDFHFRIRDLVVPDTDGIDSLATKSEETCFIFPFDNPKKPPATAVQEVANGLQNLGNNTLLFLSHIRKIDYVLPDGSKGSLECIEHDNRRIEIRSTKPNAEPEISHWLRFQKEVEVANDDDGNPQSCRIAIAYSLVEDINKKTEAKQWKIVPLDHGQVSIYFPAEKETSNLKFHLHAPFASTVARDSVRDCTANGQLRDHIAGFVVESLVAIRDQGLLNRSFLEALPDSRSNLSDFYQPIGEKIWTALSNQPLIPTFTGDFAAGKQLYHASDDKDDKLKNLLDSGDLARLEDRSDDILGWCLDVPETLRSKIGITSINTSQFVQKLKNPPFMLSHWLELKENAWMQQFYSYLQPRCLELKQEPLVRLNDGSHVISSKAYFPSNGTINDKDFPSVCALTYESGNEEQQEERKQAHEFLKNIGVTEVTECRKIELIIKKWKDEKPSDEDYLAHLRRFIDFCEKDRHSCSVFNGEPIFWGDSKDGKIVWCNAKQLFIDSPLCDTGIRSWFSEEPNYYPLSKKYANLPSFDTDALVKFAKHLGARVKAEITSDDIRKTVNRWAINPPNDKDYLRYFPQFIKSDHSLYYLFKDRAIFWGDTKDGSTRMCKAEELLIDEPLKYTGLKAWYFCESSSYNDSPYKNHYLLSHKYHEFPFTEDLLKFAKQLGAKDKLSIEKAKTQDNPDEKMRPKTGTRRTGTEDNQDWIIRELEKN